MVVIDLNRSNSTEEEYINSPGRFRQKEEFRWKWDFSESKIRAGHDCLTESDRALSKSKMAKLTFGEVLDSGVSKMLYNLGAIKKKKFNDLGMGTGKMLIQTFLSFPNIKTCVGVELSEGRYVLAEQNLNKLLIGGWRGRKFEVVEFKEKTFMKIVEIPVYAKTDYRIGDHVVAYNINLRTDKYQKIDYHAKVVGISDDKLIVKYEDHKTLEVNRKYIFKPGSVRTCEI